jgi:hypothetical protein
VCCGIGVLWGVEEFVLGFYSYAVYAPHPPIPATHLVEGLVGWIWILPVNLTFFFLPFLFPDGEPVSPRWWPLAWVALGGVAIGIAGATAGITVLSLSGQIIELTCAVLAACTLVIRYRRARLEERQQIKWFAGAALLLAGLAVASTVVSFVVYHNGYVVFNPVGGIALPLGLAGLAAAIGISVLRYHLYDIGVFLRRTLVYAVLVALIGAVYLVLVVSIGTRIDLPTTTADRAIPFVVSLHRYPPEMEAAVYFCCLEALQNAIKHAQATTMVISVGESAGELSFTAADDGQGIDVARARSGSGIQNMMDRMAALDGSLDLGTAPGGGTIVSGRLPGQTRGPGLADPPIVAEHAARHRLVRLGRLQRAQAFGPHQDHLVIAPAAGVMNPGHPGPPGAIALMPLPGEQVPGHAARQLDERRRPWCPGPRHDSSMRNCVR